MNLIMITPHVGTSNPLFGFIPEWIASLAQHVEKLWVISPRIEVVTVPENVILYQVGRDYNHGETILNAFGNFHKVIWKLIHQEQIHGVFAHMYPKFALMAAPYTKFRGIPLILWYTHKTVSQQLRIASVLVDRIVTAAPGTCQLRTDKVIPIGHGIETGKYRQSMLEPHDQERPWQLLSIGRISPAKHLEVILQAIEILVYQENFRNLHLKIVGGPPQNHTADYFNGLQKQVGEKLLESFISFTGNVPYTQIPQIIHGADLFISASQTGVDKAVLEAMAGGLIPIVSLEDFRTSLGSYGDLLIFPAKNSEELAKRIQRIVQLGESEITQIRRRMIEMIRDGHDVRILMQNLTQIFQEIRSIG